MCPVKLDLSHPIALPDGTRVRALLVHLPSFDELDDLMAAAADVCELRLAAYCLATGLDQTIIDELDLEDIHRLDDVLNHLSAKDRQ